MKRLWQRFLALWHREQSLEKSFREAWLEKKAREFRMSLEWERLHSWPSIATPTHCQGIGNLVKRRGK